MTHEAGDLGGQIREWGRALGFSNVGIAPAKQPPGGPFLREWLDRGYHGQMAWMARDPLARTEPERILPGLRSVVVVSLNYFHPRPGSPGDAGEKSPHISRYAWGDDYHEIMKEKLSALAERIRAVSPQTRTRICCDTSPVMDKTWAVSGGLGWLGKNTCVIDPMLGSWLFLGEIFLDLELPADAPSTDRCGSCRRCLEVCPTQALVEPYVLDARRCISYLNIEFRGEFQHDQARALGSWLVGCDLCQDICPWNRRAPVSGENRFAPRNDLLDVPAEVWAEMPDHAYREGVRGTAISRIRPPEMRRNARAVIDNRPGATR